MFTQPFKNFHHRYFPLRIEVVGSPGDRYHTLYPVFGGLLQTQRNPVTVTAEDRFADTVQETGEIAAMPSGGITIVGARIVVTREVVHEYFPPATNEKFVLKVPVKTVAQSPV